MNDDWRRICRQRWSNTWSRTVFTAVADVAIVKIDGWPLVPCFKSDEYRCHDVFDGYIYRVTCRCRSCMVIVIDVWCQWQQLLLWRLPTTIVIIHTWIPESSGQEVEHDAFRRQIAIQVMLKSSFDQTCSYQYQQNSFHGRNELQSWSLVSSRHCILFWEGCYKIMLEISSHIYFA